MTLDQIPTFVHVNPNFLNDGYSAAAAFNTTQHFQRFRPSAHDEESGDGHFRGGGGGYGRGGPHGPRGVPRIREHRGDLGGDDDDHHMRLPMSDARRMRKTIFRRTIDYNTPVMIYLEDRIYRRGICERRWIQPDYLYQALLVPPFDMLDTPMNCVTTKHVRTSTNKNKCPIFALCWTPEGRRLITGSSSGEFTLWNGLTFNFETILQAHDSPIRYMLWSHNEEWLLTADNAGFVKYWQANMNNVKVYQAHKDPVRGVSFCCSDSKFVTCSDDSTVRVWDFVRCQEERVLRGHGADVRCVAWHPWKSLIISGSKDAQQPIKLWDPKSGQSLATLYVHKNTCTDVAWNANGNWFLTASRDHQIKLFDVRNMRREVQIYRGHRKDVMRVAWHPHHESLFASGGADGAIMYWMVGAEMEVGAVEDAHEHMIWSLAWHPLGHLIVSGSNDFTTKFWTRNRPGDVLKESAARSIANTSFLSSNPTVGTPNKEEKLQRPKAAAAAATATAVATTPVSTGAERAVTNTAAATADDGTVIIPGLFEGSVSDQNIASDDLDEKARKARLQKSIPRAFAANWASARSAAMPALLPNPVQPIEPTIGNAVVSVAQAPNAAAVVLSSAALQQHQQQQQPQRPPPAATPMDFDNMSVLDEDYDNQSVISEVSYHGASSMSGVGGMGPRNYMRGSGNGGGGGGMGPPHGTMGPPGGMGGPPTMGPRSMRGPGMRPQMQTAPPGTAQGGNYGPPGPYQRPPSGNYGMMGGPGRPRQMPPMQGGNFQPPLPPQQQHMPPPSRFARPPHPQQSGGGPWGPRGPNPGGAGQGPPPRMSGPPGGQYQQQQQQRQPPFQGQKFPQDSGHPSRRPSNSRDDYDYDDYSVYDEYDPDFDYDYDYDYYDGGEGHGGGRGGGGGGGGRSGSGFGSYHGHMSESGGVKRGPQGPGGPPMSKQPRGGGPGSFRGGRRGRGRPR